ncbi:unnamed protein product [Prorocentrum cordatum]|uniref:Uncharacterized protein n=1 Tax=Prorocentrum cordatum TaxID=2364126 RepID=A0ABN9V4P0_9DINO|nr:unnamed protein product [Polarella glacialis]
MVGLAPWGRCSCAPLASCRGGAESGTPFYRRGRVEMAGSAQELQEGVGAFGSVGVAQAAARFVAAGAPSPAFRAYCQWRAYDEALASAEARRRFAASLGPRLVRDVLGCPLPSGASGARDVEALVDGLRGLLARCERGLLAAWELVDFDEVAAELWAERRARTLTLAFFLVGDPLEDAQILLSEQRDAVIASRGVVVPDVVAQAAGAWVRARVPGCAVSAESFYAGMRYGSVFGPLSQGQVKLQIAISEPSGAL